MATQMLTDLIEDSFLGSDPYKVAEHAPIVVGRIQSEVDGWDQLRG